MAERRGAEHATNILTILSEATRPLGAYELLDRLRPTGVAAPLTVYRALDKLIAAGKVHRVASLNAFVLCRAGDHDDHSHSAAQDPHGTVGFAICDKCKTVEEFTGPDLSDAVTGSLRARGFHLRESAIEVHGLCAACSTGPGG